MPDGKGIPNDGRIGWTCGMSEAGTICVVVPGYQEEGRIGKVVRDIRAYASDVVVVDDGSRDRTGEEARAGGAIVLRHETNKGKGAALATGLSFAAAHGYECVITMDADGQHAASDIPAFVETYRRTGTPVLVGNRMGHADGMPLVRRWTNRFMSWLLSRHIGQRVPDTQNGFRLYRCDVLPPPRAGSEGFAAESEILLQLGLAGVTIGAVPTKTIYGDEKSKISPVADTLRFFRMLRRWTREHPAGSQRRR